MLRILPLVACVASGFGIRLRIAHNTSENMHVDGIPLMYGPLSETKWGSILAWEKKLGSGAFGSVSLYSFRSPCEDDVVIKEIKVKHGSFGEPGFTMEDIKNEIEKTRFVTSSHLLQVYDSVIGSSTTPSYILMEPAYGGTLINAFFNQAGGWTGGSGRLAGKFSKGGSDKRHGVKNRILAMALVGTLRGLSDLHAKNVIHRDLKPENIFATDKGVECVASMNCRYVLGDFGIATNAWMTAKVNGFEIHYTTDLAGTMVYLPPEVRENAKPMEGAPKEMPTRFWTTGSDVWALGMSIHEMLSSTYSIFRTPLTSGQLNNVLRRKIKSAAWLHPDVRQLLSDMTEENWIKRPTASAALSRAEQVFKESYGDIPKIWGASWPTCLINCQHGNCLSNKQCQAKACADQPIM